MAYERFNWTANTTYEDLNGFKRAMCYKYGGIEHLIETTSEDKALYLFGYSLVLTIEVIYDNMRVYGETKYSADVDEVSKTITITRTDPTVAHHYSSTYYYYYENTRSKSHMREYNLYKSNLEKIDALKKELAPRPYPVKEELDNNKVKAYRSSVAKRIIFGSIFLLAMVGAILLAVFDHDNLVTYKEYNGHMNENPFGLIMVIGFAIVMFVVSMVMFYFAFKYMVKIKAMIDEANTFNDKYLKDKEEFDEWSKTYLQERPRIEKSIKELEEENKRLIESAKE